MKLTEILKQFGDFFREADVPPPVMKVSAADLLMISKAIESELNSWFMVSTAPGVVEYDGVRFELVDRAAPAPPFKPGDVVTLKHGGERMTVDRTYPESKERFVEGVWFDADGHLKRDRFPAECMVHAETADLPSLVAALKAKGIFMCP